MNTKKLQSELNNKGFHKTAKLISDISSQHPGSIKTILDECKPEETNLPSDIDILRHQLHALKTYEVAYHEILLRDLQIILYDFLHPDERKGTDLFMEKEEIQEAVNLYRQAMQGDTETQVALAEFYRSIGRDEWAFAWYEKAADAGNLDALYWVGNYYFDGVVVDKDEGKAFACYEEAAWEGHPDAMNNYADMHFRGEYVEKDVKRGFELFSIAAERGVPESMYTVGYMYTNGIGVEKNLEMARHWIERSALSGDSYAANHLGQEAFEQDKGEEAYRWFQMAADRQDAVGLFNLGFCHVSGIGTSIDIKKAKRLYQQAALLGDVEAKERLKELGNH